MLCSVSFAKGRDFRANGPISSFHISGGFLLILDRKEAVVIVVVFSEFSNGTEPPILLSFNYFILLAPGYTLIYCIVRPKHFVLLTFLISSSSTSKLPISEILLICLSLPIDTYAHFATLRLSSKIPSNSFFRSSKSCGRFSLLAEILHLASFSCLCFFQFQVTLLQ